MKEDDMVKNILKQYIEIIGGIILVAISIEYFFAPYDIAAGGVSGAAIIINRIMPSISISVITLILNIMLFIVAFILVGSEFGGRTIITSVLLSIILWIIETFFAPKSLTDDILLSTIFGSLLSAGGIAIVFFNNSSTGGTDILAKILNRIFHIDIGKSLLAIDFIVTLFSVLIFGLNLALYALIGVIIQGIMIDKFVDGFHYSRELLIISDKNMQIGKYINDKLSEKYIYFIGKSADNSNEINILYTILGRSDYIKLKQYVMHIDEEAFISVREGMKS
ncbi:MAG: YitT family protein [Clostridium sp.]|nr:YitT family protein [Clostridium sp.]